MKRILVLAGLVPAIVAASAFGTAAESDYNGDFNGDPFPGSSIAFAVDRGPSGHKKVKNVFASGLPYDCEEGSPGVPSSHV